jgi:hypothetical protein
MLVIALMMIGTASASAQETEEAKGTTPEERAQSLTNWMTEFLKLEDNQKEAVNKVNMRFAEKMASNWEANKTDHPALMKGGKEIDETHTAELAEVLRPGQWTKYQRYKNTHRVSEKERYRMYITMGGGKE